MRFKTLLLVLVFTSIPFQQIFAWGQEGHRIIGQIAYNHLNKKAKKNVDAILGERGIVYWANWADEIKSDTIYPNSSQWHFQDLDGGMSDAEVVATLTNYPAEGGMLWRVMDSLTQELHLHPDNFDALRFFIHLTGDCFCPMHTGHLDDLGGNKVKMKWFGQNSNLHRVWDSDLISARGYSFSEYAEYLESHFADERSYVMGMTKPLFLLHNYHLCNQIYDYQQNWDENTYHYIYRFAEDMERQLYFAGLYLADMLNEIYG